jgi:hypothetical protein
VVAQCESGFVPTHQEVNVAKIFPDQLGIKPDEHWLRFTAEGPAEGEGAAGKDVVVVSGYRYYTDGLLTGNPDSDSAPEYYECQIFVGPKWRGVNAVSPVVTVGGYSHFSSDTADVTGYRVEWCKWDFELGQSPAAGSQIRLKTYLHARGGADFSIRCLAYHLSARGILIPGQDQDFADHRQLP